MKKGKFIVIYGINNIGKTTQAKKLVGRMKKEGYKVKYMKYPIYDLEPAGKLINEYLREGNPYKFSCREFQLLHFIDRKMQEEKLKEYLNKGINVVAEDYFGTAVAWGTGSGVEKRLLEYLNTFVYPEDLAILLHGNIFETSMEKEHKHESNSILLKKVQKIHLNLGKKFGWKKIKANQSVEEVSQDIWQEVKNAL